MHVLYKRRDRRVTLLQLIIHLIPVVSTRIIVLHDILDSFNFFLIIRDRSISIVNEFLIVVCIQCLAGGFHFSAPVLNGIKDGLINISNLFQVSYREFTELFFEISLLFLKSFNLSFCFHNGSHDFIPFICFRL